MSEYSDVEYVFEPHSATTPDIREYLRSLWDRRAFMVELARADRRTAEAETALGNLWSVLNPLFQAGIYYFLYATLRSSASSKLAADPHRQLLLLRPQHAGDVARAVGRSSAARG